MHTLHMRRIAPCIVYLLCSVMLLLYAKTTPFAEFPNSIRQAMPCRSSLQLYCKDHRSLLISLLKTFCYFNSLIFHALFSIICSFNCFEKLLFTYICAIFSNSPFRVYIFQGFFYFQLNTKCAVLTQFVQL